MGVLIEQMNDATILLMKNHNYLAFADALVP